MGESVPRVQPAALINRLFRFSRHINAFGWGAGLFFCIILIVGNFFFLNLSEYNLR